jgi:hypothetical protein
MGKVKLIQLIELIEVVVSALREQPGNTDFEALSTKSTLPA